LNSAGTANLSSNFVYIWSWATDPSRQAKTGENLNYYTLTGMESLVINFTSTLSTNYVIDLFSYNQAAIEQGLNYTNKLTL
jgi:hypothetical protein